MKHQNLLLTALAVEYMEHCEARNLSPKTRKIYSRWIEGFLSYLAKENVTRWNQLEPRHFRRFLASLSPKKANPSPWTVHQAFRTIKAWVRWVMREYGLSQNPMHNVDPPQLPRPIPAHLELEQVRALLDAAQKTRHPERDTAIISLMVDLGLRAGEVLALTINDIHSDHLIVSGKGNRERLLPLTGPVKDVLDRWLQVRGGRGEHLFPSEQGPCLTDSGLRQLVERVGLKAGIQGVHPHLLRHTYATLSLENGADMAGIQRILGHSSIAVTEKFYTRIRLSYLREHHARSSPLNQLFNSEKAPGQAGTEQLRRLPATTSKKTQALAGDKDIQRLLDGLKMLTDILSRSDHPERDMVILFLHHLDMGLSAEEIAQLNLDDVYEYEGLRVPGRAEPVSVPDPVSLAIERWLQVRDDWGENAALFPSGRTGRMAAHDIRQTLKQLQAALPESRRRRRLLVMALGRLYLAMDGHWENLARSLHGTGDTTS